MKKMISSLDTPSDLEAIPHYPVDAPWNAGAFELLETCNPTMQKVFECIQAVAPTKSTVLLTGETGTGKGVMAKAIHRFSPRKKAPFIVVHCGAIPDTLVESELFGHEKGAFTGAIKQRTGKFETAQGGTIFLDEIGTVSHSVQIKLLQVLQDALFQRIGGEKDIQTDVRIIAATNVDLKQLCDEKLFRRDLFYRLHVFPIVIPPLRERKEDIPKFTGLFLKKLNTFYSKNIHRIHPRVEQAFVEYPWPGNIREFENVMERAYILETGTMLMPDNFPADIFPDSPALTPSEIDQFIQEDLPLSEVRKRGIETIERIYLEKLLMKHHGKIKLTAQAAGISTRHLHKLMTRYKMDKAHFKSEIASHIQLRTKSS